jgi:hypothetical protein
LSIATSEYVWVTELRPSINAIGHLPDVRCGEIRWTAPAAGAEVVTYGFGIVVDVVVSLSVVVASLVSVVVGSVAGGVVSVAVGVVGAGVGVGVVVVVRRVVVVVVWLVPEGPIEWREV